MTDPTTPAIPAGWYPDGVTSGQERYWDGTAWTEHFHPVAVGPAAATVAPPTATVAPLTVANVGPTLAPAKKKRKWPWIVGAGVAAVILIPAIATAATGGGSADQESAAVVGQAPEAEVIEDTRVEIPDMTGMTVAEAVAALALVNITLELPADVGDDWIVSSQTVPGGSKIEPGDPLSISAAAPAPVYTLAQQNAIRKAQSYLNFSGFSRTGLIGQLEYEGFSTEEATFGADNAGADWNAEAAEKAASYLEFTAFSREGLYDQMAYEGFTESEILFGLTAVGY